VVADAFFVAFRFPNLFRRLFAEGAFNAAFVPLFAKRLEGEGGEAARSFAEEALAVLLFALLALTAIAMIAMPWLMLGLAPGFSDTPEKFDLAVLLTRIAFPYLLCMSLVALLSGVLNALHRFAAAAAAPILLNIVLISVMAGAAWAGLGNTPAAGVALAWGVTVAGCLQLFMLAVASYRAGMGLGFRWPRLTPGVRRLLALGVPGVIAGGVTQINLVVGTIIASLQDGAISYLYYADRVYQLPLGVVGVAIGVVLLPDIARRLRAGDTKGVLDSQNRALEFALLLTLPAAVALVVIAEPISRVLFERGAFTPADTRATALALAAFAVGLPSFVLIKVFQPAFFAREDTRTPMRLAIVNMVVNVGLSVALFYALGWAGMMGHLGIAIATTIAGWINVVMLWAELVRRGELAADRRLRRTAPLILAASLGMGVVLWGAGHWLEPLFARANGSLVQAGALLALIGAGSLVYFAAVHVSGAMPLGTVRKALRRSGS
jgi:putative peptidoglycan lipid II flippase